LAASGVALDQTASLLLTLRFETHSRPPKVSGGEDWKGDNKK
jgi:hypothetical protein